MYIPCLSSVAECRVAYTGFPDSVAGGLMCLQTYRLIISLEKRLMEPGQSNGLAWTHSDWQQLSRIF